MNLIEGKNNVIDAKIIIKNEIIIDIFRRFIYNNRIK